MAMIYKCSGCGTDTPANETMVKKAVFTTTGVGPRTIRSRVVGHFCPRCIRSDQDWNREARLRPDVREAG